MMNLYLIEHKNSGYGYGYGTVFAVVSAKDSKSARKTMQRFSDLSEHENASLNFLDASKSTLNKIGVATGNSAKESQVVIAHAI